MTRMRCLQPPAGAAAAAARAHAGALPVLETERLRLRAPTLADLDLWLTLWTETGGAAQTAEAAWEGFCVYVAGWLLHGHGLWIVDRKADGAPVGFVLLGLEWGDAEPEIGWALDPAHRGRGYATEAAMAVRDHAVALLGPGLAVSYIGGDNRASARVAQRLGARRDRAAEAALGDVAQVWRHAGTGACR